MPLLLITFDQYHHTQMAGLVPVNDDDWKLSDWTGPIIVHGNSGARAGLLAHSRAIVLYNCAVVMLWVPLLLLQLLLAVAALLLLPLLLVLEVDVVWLTSFTYSVESSR